MHPSNNSMTLPCGTDSIAYLQIHGPESLLPHPALNLDYLGVVHASSSSPLILFPFSTT